MIAITVARKPLIRNVATTAMASSCGGINIDACRMDRPEYLGRNNAKIKADTAAWVGAGMGLNNAAKRAVAGLPPLGRWPANLILEHQPECVRKKEIVEQEYEWHCSPTCGAEDLREQGGSWKVVSSKNHVHYGGQFVCYGKQYTYYEYCPGDEGFATRYFKQVQG